MSRYESPKNLPNFFILGAAKAGSTSLYSYLKQHPQVYLPNDKEPHFFDNDIFYEEGLASYLDRHFGDAEQYPARGEATPGYFHCHQKVIPRMIEVYGDQCPRFITIFRDPVRRAWSHYLHRVRNALEDASFEQALKLEPARLQRENSGWVGYFSDGLYAEQLTHWLQYFPKENFYFMLTEDLRFDAREAMKKLFRFLRVDDSVQVDTSGKENVASAPRSAWFMRFLSKRSFIKRPIGVLLSPYSKRRIRERLRRMNSRANATTPQLDKAVEKELREKYRDDVKRLERLIDRDLSAWLGE